MRGKDLTMSNEKKRLYGEIFQQKSKNIRGIDRSSNPKL